MQCKQCNKPLEASRGTKPRQFCSDACRKLYKRTLDNKRTEQTDSNEQATNSSIPIETLAMVDAACGDKLSHGLPANYGQPNCQCWHCHNYRAAKKDTAKKDTAKLNHGPWLNAEQLAEQGYMANRVSLPGDIDYEVVAV